MPLSLHQIGVDVLLCESVPEVKPLGVGINLFPHATRELTELGLIERRSPIAVKTSDRIAALFTDPGATTGKSSVTC